MLSKNNYRISVMITDDDAGMRLLLRKVIDRDERFLCVAEADGVEAAVSAYDMYKPDVIFMDIDMPDGSGIDCARRIHDINPMTKIVFVTAYDSYMADAFKVYAFDYIVKPFQVERVSSTLDTIAKMVQPSGLQPVLSVAEKAPCSDRLGIKTKDGYIIINMRDIILIQREDRSTVIYTEGGGRYSTAENLTDLAARLDGQYLMRVHKSYIINIGRISEVYVYGRWTYLARFSGTDVDALITADNFDKIKDIYGLK